MMEIGYSEVKMKWFAESVPLFKKCLIDRNKHELMIKKENISFCQEGVKWCIKNKLKSIDPRELDKLTANILGKFSANKMFSNLKMKSEFFDFSYGYLYANKHYGFIDDKTISEVLEYFLQNNTEISKLIPIERSFEKINKINKERKDHQERFCIFISYSHQDIRWKNLLLKHISALQDDHIAVWDDSRIRTGDHWRYEIDAAMKVSRIAVLLISADFLASNFIRNVEIPILLERHSIDGLRIFPIIVSDCAWKRVPWLSCFQARPVQYGVKPLAALPDHQVDFVLGLAAMEIQDFMEIPAQPHVPAPGAAVPPTTKYDPGLFIGIRINKSNPLRIDFILSEGTDHSDEVKIRKCANELTTYFLTCLSLPEENIWVNLSPAEPEKIIPLDLSSTKMGQTLLSQDYILKQFNATLMHPETKTGELFWNEAYSEANKKFGSHDVPINTFNRVWILPEEAYIWEHDGLCLITKKSLKAMLEEDYLTLTDFINKKESIINDFKSNEANNISSFASKAAGKTLLPTIYREVNEGRTFAPLRQIYNCLILSKWYKETLLSGFMKKLYINSGKLDNLKTGDNNFTEKMFSQYCDAFSRGVFNYIREDYDPRSQDTIPRKYFSGGILAQTLHDCLSKTNDTSLEHAEEVIKSLRACYIVKIILKPVTGGNAQPSLSDSSDSSVAGIDFSIPLELQRDQKRNENLINTDFLLDINTSNIIGFEPELIDIVRIFSINQLI